MTPATIQARLDAIRAIRTNPDYDFPDITTANAMISDLYRDALRAIADGVPDAQVLAREALEAARLPEFV